MTTQKVYTKETLQDRRAQLSAEKQSRLVQRLQNQKSFSPQWTIPPRSVKGPVPLSFLQERLWFLFEWEPDSPTYNEMHLVTHGETIDVSAMAAAHRELMQRHEILRTLYRYQDGEPVQEVRPVDSWYLPFIDLSHLPSESKEIELQRITKAEANRPFNLRRECAYRPLLVRLANTHFASLIAQHHIACDGWSFKLRDYEWTTLYAAFAAGLPSPLPDLPIQYADYACWQRQQLDEERRQTLETYWKTKLAHLAKLILPTDKAMPPERTSHGQVFESSFSPALSKRIERFSQQEEVTTYMVSLAAFKTLLWRYSGQTDMALGSSMSMRDLPELESVIGFLVETIVLRTDLAGDPSFRELLQRVRQVVLEAFDHKDLPFSQVVNAVQPQRQADITSLVSVLFEWQDWQALTGMQGKNRKSWSSVRQPSDTAKFELSLAVERVGDRFQFWWEYSTDLFEEDTIARMMGHFETLLSAAITDPDVRLSQLPLLTEAEQQAVMEWNSTGVNYQENGCIPELFQQQVAKTPEATAVIFEDQMLTYQALNSRANQLAHTLRRYGVGPEVRVGICVDRSLEMVIGLYGILKAGGVYVPIDPTYPDERLNFMLKNARVAVLLTQATLKAKLSALSVPIVCLDDDWGPVSRESTATLVSPVMPQTLAYTIYTSGSTGQPKGVMNTHAGMRNRLLWMQEAYPLTAVDRVMQKTPFGFDVSVWEFFWPLITGAALVVAKPDGHKDPDYLIQLIEAHHVTTMHFVPSMLQAFVTNPQVKRCRALKRVICSGEALPYDLQERFMNRLTAELHNLYGPTEAAIDVTFWACQTDSRRLVPIGHPIANTQIHLLDPFMNPVPVGIAGELYIGGINLARGYLGQPGLTAQKFVPDPFSHSPGSRLYKTGDLARYRLNGSIEFLGRIDYQVKVRGFRIEPGEIEAILDEHPGIREALVIAWDSGEEIGDKQLVAYLVLTPGEALTESALTEYLQTKLPAFMVPALFVMLDAFPLTPNGKIDRQALPHPHAVSQLADIPFVPPRDETEEMIASIWSNVLKVEQLSIYDNFFALGGHSLLVAQVVSRIRETMHIDLPLQTIFTSPTIASLKKQVEEDRYKQQGVTMPAIRAVPRHGHLPYSFAQQRLWFLDQLMAGSFTYNTFMAISLSGELDQVALTRALNEIVRRHEVLRTTFPDVDGEPTLHIHPHEPSFLSIIDLSPLAADLSLAEGKRVAELEVNRQFNLEGTVYRMLLLRLSAEAHIFLIVIRHIASDAWSERVMLRELSLLYSAFTSGQPSPLPELPIQYADYAVWQRAYLQGPLLAKQAAYWRQQLAGVSTELALPVDRPRAVAQTSKGAMLTFTFSEALSSRLKVLTRQEGATLFMTLLAALEVLLYRYSGQEDFLVGTLMTNRNQTDLEALIGLFLNTVVLRADLSDNPDFRTLLHRTKEVVLGAYTHQDYPFEQLVNDLQPHRDLTHSPLFQVMLLLQNVPKDDDHSLPDKLQLTPANWALEDDAAKVDLLVVVRDMETHLSGEIQYNVDLFDPVTIKRLFTHFETLCEHITRAPETPVASLPLLTSGEQEILLQSWNETARAYPREQCFHELFAAQVAQNPTAVAALFDEQTWTYEALNTSANKMAYFLREQGVGPDVIVALLMPRSVDFLIAMLAVFKAGGAYLPLDPDDPPARLIQVLQQSKSPFVITTQGLQPDLLTGMAAAVTAWPVTVQPQVFLIEVLKQMDYGGENPPWPCSPANLAYVIFTSGSTGTPKGAMLPHQGMVNHLYAKVADLSLQAVDKVAQTARQTFDISIWQYLSPLLVGGQVHIYNSDVVSDPDLLLHLVQQQGTTILEVVPSFLQVILDETLPRQKDKLPLSDLRWLLVTGEALPPNLCDRWLSYYIDIPLLNAYGPTECSDDVAHYAIHKPLGPDAVNTPIGRPVANTQLYILDGQWQPTPVGVVGELYVGGEGVGRGYHDDARRTAMAFVPNPFSPQPGARLYKSGDKARFLPDGSIEFLGRVDYQAKIRGFRIELGEIEAVLRQHTAVSQVIVSVWQRPGSSVKNLVAYLVTASDATLDTAELRQFLRSRLPEYMIPAALVFLAEFPLTPNGKINRRALPAPDMAFTEREENYVAPQSETEYGLAEIWGDVLNQDRIGIYDSFFELGGHSLLAIRIVSRIRKQFEVDLPLRAFFEDPTVAGLARHIENHQWATRSFTALDDALAVGDGFEEFTL